MNIHVLAIIGTLVAIFFFIFFATKLFQFAQYMFKDTKKYFNAHTQLDAIASGSLGILVSMLGVAILYIDFIIIITFPWKQ